MTIKEARKILGVLSNGMTDETIMGQIESAELLKNIFFKIYLQRSHKNIDETVVKNVQ